MAFFGALFLAIPVLFWRARVERINPLVALDGGALFAATGQIFGRIGNIINGDIVGYRSNLPWATLYQNPHSFFCMGLADPTQCGNPATAVQPAAVYEILLNIVLLVILFSVAYRLRRPGLLMAIYLFGYAITQFFVFFVRDNLVVSFLGLNWGLKQAQWTSLVLFILLIPATILLFRISKPVPPGEVPATYGIPQKPGKKPALTQGEAVKAEETSDEASAPSPVEDGPREQDQAASEEGTTEQPVAKASDVE
jgi:phosphatidylglycerol:prolipoprotein diacylglycerol transferase